MSTVARSTRRFSFFGVMGAVFAAVAVIGFAPNSVAILTGEKANPPLIIHLHAAAMSAWMALLAAQSWLMGAGKAAVHRNLGVAALVLAPVVFTLILTITVHQIRTGLGEPMVLLIQSKRLLGFGICVGLAYLWRTTRSAAHKRLMFLGTFVVLDAAFFRMGWLLPGLAHEHHIAVAHAWQLLLLVPFVVYDIRTLGRVHPVFLVGIPALVAFDVMAAVMR